MGRVVQRETYVNDYSARIDPNYYSYTLAPSGAVVLPVGEEGPTSASAPQGSIQQVDAADVRQAEAPVAAETPTGVDLGATATSQALAADGGVEGPGTAVIPEDPEGLPVTGSFQPRPEGVGNPFAPDFVDAPPGGPGPLAVGGGPTAPPIAGFTSTTEQELAAGASKSKGGPQGASSAPRSHPVSTKTGKAPRQQEKITTRAQRDRLVRAEDAVEAHVDRVKKGRAKRN